MHATVAKTEKPGPVRPRAFTWNVQSSEIGFMGPVIAAEGAAGCADCTGGCVVPSDRPRSKRPGAPGPQGAEERK